MSRRAKKKEQKGRRKIESLIDMREDDVFESKNVRDVSYLDKEDKRRNVIRPATAAEDSVEEVEEKNEYERLLDSLSDVKVGKHEALFRKRKLEEEGKTDEDIAKESKKAKKRRLLEEKKQKKASPEDGDDFVLIIGDDEAKVNRKADLEGDTLFGADEDWLNEKAALQKEYKRVQDEVMKEAEEGNVDEDVPDELPAVASDGEGEGSEDSDEDAMSVESDGDEAEEAVESDGEDQDEDKDEGLTEGIEVLTEAEKRDDPYALHFETALNSKQLEQEKGWKELEEIKGVGKVWSDRLTSLPPKRESLEGYKVKQRIVEPWNAYYKKELSSKGKRKPKDKLQMTDLQEELFPILNDYKDLLFCHRSHQNQKQIQSLYTLHVVDHVLKIRDRVLRNNLRLKHARSNGDNDLEIRDQGFTRPRVLVLLPTRNDCFEFIQMILKLAPKIQTDRVANKKKFYQEFLEETYVPFTRKPPDWLARFRGNMDDSFRMGVTFTAKYMRLYSEFYKSDLIVASPLGLRLAIEEHQGDVDYLSSIELLILDQAEYHLMQNFEHVKYVLERLNIAPKQYRDADITRIGMLNLDDQAKQFRQTLIFSEVIHGDLNLFFNKFALNAKGRVKIQKNSISGTVMNVVPQLKQLFQRLEVKSLQEADDVRFKYFCEQVYPHIITEQAKGVLIFIPSYFDFVRVRNYMRDQRKTSDMSFTQCCEYTPSGHVTRARSNFFHQKREIMLYTERFHFFNRYQIRGIQKIIFYAPPQFPHFYPEMLNLVTNVGSSLVLFSKFDVYQLEPIVGAARLQRLLTSDKSNHMFQ